MRERGFQFALCGSSARKVKRGAEGLVRNLPVFSEFLNTAALSDAEIVNFSKIARECGVSGHTVKSYFGILEDTLLGRWLPAYRRRPKRRVIGALKFYFADVGVVNRLARRGDSAPEPPCLRPAGTPRKPRHSAESPTGAVPRKVS